MIQNNKTCAVTLHHRVFNGSSGCVLQCSVNNAVIPGGSFILIPCVTVGPSVKEITLIRMGGMVISPIGNVNYGMGSTGGGSWPCFTMLSQTATGPVPGAATGACASFVWSITVSPAITNIN